MAEGDEEAAQELNNYVQGMQGEMDKLVSENSQLKQGISSSMGMGRDSNLIEGQLDTAILLDKLEHFYRGDQIGFDEITKEPCWNKPTDNELITFNEFGVSSLMEILTRYIDKNTSLSYYSEQRVYEILGDLGSEIILFVECNYEKMGMDTYFKKTKFRLIVTTTLHTIESAYRRAIQGKTFEGLNQSKLVTQNDNMGASTPVGYQKKSFLSKVFNPGRYMR